MKKLYGKPNPCRLNDLICTSTRLVSTSVPTNTTTGSSNVVVTRIPNMYFKSSPLFQNFQNNPIGSTPFVQGYPWYGGHIPPSSLYVGPTPNYSGVSYGS